MKDPFGRDCPEIAKVRKSKPKKGFATLLSQGIDYVQESWHYFAELSLLRQLEIGQKCAQRAGMGKKARAVFELGNQRFLIRPCGSQGIASYVLEGENFYLFIRTGNNEWAVSVRYLARGLWETGWDTLHEEVRHLMDTHFSKSYDPVQDCHAEPVVTRIDYCFDLYSPTTTKQMTNRDLAKCSVSHSSSKQKTISNSSRDETIDFSLNITGHQNALYDKSVQITEVSGKSWIADEWARTLPNRPFEEEVIDDETGEVSIKYSDVWRVELRFGKEYLADRNCRTVSNVKKYLPLLLAEGLVKQRLTTLRGEKCLRNRPMHGLWTLASDTVGVTQRLPIGKRTTGRREVLLQRSVTSMAGSMRSHVALDMGEMSIQELRALAMAVAEHAYADPKKERKFREAIDRNEFVDVRSG